MRQEECNAVRNPYFLGLGDFPQCLSAVNKNEGFIRFGFFGLQMRKLCNWNIFYAGE